MSPRPPPREATPIYMGRDFYVPCFEVRLAGNALPRDVVRDVTQVTYRDSIDQIDSFEITINNWDAETLDFKYLESSQFDPGNNVELWMGYYGGEPLRLMMRGEITALRPTFPAAGQPTLSISGQNVLRQFLTKPESHRYEKLTDSEIAQQIGARLGKSVRLDPEAAAAETRYDYLIQDNKRDIMFLMDLARRNDYDLFVEEIGADGEAKETQLYFGPSEGVKRAIYELAWGKSLVEFQPNLSTANQVSEVTVRGWDPVNKQNIEYTAKRQETKARGVGARGRQSDLEKSFARHHEVITNSGVATLQEARRLAIQLLEKNTKSMLSGTGTTVGLPHLRAGSVVQITGPGGRFGGRYFITSSTHTIGDSGYTTRFEFRREETA